MFSAGGSRLSLEEFEDVKNQMESFSLRFNNLVLEKKSQVLNSKQQHINHVNELERKIQNLRGEIEAIKARKTKTSKVIGETFDELSAKQSKVEEMNAQLQTLTEEKEKLETEIEALKSLISGLEELLKSSQNNLNEQLAKDVGELTKYEMYLGLRIEAVDIDLLKFKFTNIDANDIDKEVWCELFVGEEKYKIMGTDPTLPNQKVGQIENDFNEHGEFILFLKDMRRVLRDAA
ncbi:CIC11C00000003151 [Sungouiella intermedia]|uniref:Kinetochore protein SPC25 n=1 Tax=Sungouiella intermedia TaxID=45354 RepID=A0A1L0BT71_9ASCO|nr:CIC11C00000003151 [[Candida] intermedia]